MLPPPIHNNKTDDDASGNVYNALIFACENKNKIEELTNELKTVSAELGTMQEHFNRAVIEQSRALLAIFGALYGSQIDDIKHDYDQNEVENKMISNGLAWAADIKLQKKQPNYRDAVMRYLNEVGTSDAREVAAPEASHRSPSVASAANATPAAAGAGVQSTTAAEPAASSVAQPTTTAEPTRTTTTILSHDSTAVPAAAAAADAITSQTTGRGAITNGDETN